MVFRFPLLLLLLLTSPSFQSEDDKILRLKELVAENPTNAILASDSLLFYNHDLTKLEFAKVLYYQALAYQSNNNPKKAIKNFEKVMPIFKLNNDIELYISALLSFSNSNGKIKNHTLATSQAIEAKNLAEEHGYIDLMASANTALAFMYYSIKDYATAMEYLISSAKVLKKENKLKELSGTYNNIAIIYKNINQLNKALEYNQKSLEISKQTKHFLGIGKSYSNIGRLYFFEGKYKKAIEYYEKAIKNNRDANIVNSYPFSNLAESYSALKKYNIAEKYSKKALEIELTNQNDAAISQTYNDLLKIALKQKAYEKAYFYQQNIAELAQKISDHDAEEKSKMIDNQHRLYQREHELELAKTKAKNQKIFFIGIIAIFFFIGLFLIQKMKFSQLKNENEKVLLEQQVLRSQMNPHFIFNALSAIQNSLLDNEPLKSATYLSRFAKLIRQNFKFINQKSIPIVDEIDALTNYMETQKLRFQDKFDYTFNIDPKIDVHTLEIPPLLIQPFIENSIEHGFKNKQTKGEIIINMKMKNNTIHYEIIDNGKGFSAHEKKDNSLHAIDVFKKRLKLLNNKDEKSFSIQSSAKGTTIKFSLAI